MTQNEQKLTNYLSSFENTKFDFNGVEAWRARDIMPLLGYDTWRSFRNAITRAHEACIASGTAPSKHFLSYDGTNEWTPSEVFADAGKNPKGGRPKEDLILSRLAAYLIAMNGDPRKEEIAFAQTYFASSTRTLEKIKERLTETSRLESRELLRKTEKKFQGVLFEHGVDGTGLSIIRSMGDKILFGGKNTEDMKEEWNVPKSYPLSDFAPEVVVIAKQLSAAMTTHNTKVNKLRGTEDIADEHVANNQTIRSGLEARNIYPEKLKPEEDIKKVERRHKSDIRKLTKSTKKKTTTKRKKTG